MALTELDSESALYNLTTTQTVLTHTPSASDAMMVSVSIDVGDVSNPLSGAGGDFEYTIEIDGQVFQPAPQAIPHGTATRTRTQFDDLLVPANTSVVAKVKSPNAADSNVRVVAKMYDKGSPLSAAQVNAEVDTALADVGLTTTVTGRIDAAVSTRLASAGYTAPPSAAAVAAAVLGYVTSGTRTLQEVVALIEALVGVRTGVSSSPGSVVMKNPEGDKTRATATSDGAGNVSAVTIGDLTP